MRPSNDEYYLAMLRLVSSRSTCGRRSVGAILVDERNRVLSTGFNGVPTGFPHCDETTPCAGRFDEKGDTRRCLAVHAEMNAILTCHRLDLAYTLYVSCSPCKTCALALCNTGVRRILCLEAYADDASQILKSAGIELVTNC